MDVKDLKIGTIDSLRGDLGFRRQIIAYAVVFTVGLIVAATVVISVLLWLVWQQPNISLTDHLAGIAAIFAGMTLLLTVFAVVVAYLAFSVTQGVPDIKYQVCFGSGLPNRLAVKAKESKNGRLRAKDPALTAVVIRCRNDGTVPAKGPAVIIQLLGMEFTGDIPRPAWQCLLRRGYGRSVGWTVAERSNTGVTAVQWNHGAVDSIQEGVVIELPVLNLAGLRTIPGTARWTGPYGRIKKLRQVETNSPVIVISIVTDTSRTVGFQPVDFIVNGKSRFPPEEGNPEWLK